MNFQDAENAYRDLKQQHASGKLTDEEFEDQVALLEHQDAQGHRWQLGAETGEWYMHDGQKWNRAVPPLTSAAPPPPAESVAAVASGAAQKGTRGSVLPAERTSLAPAGSNIGGRLPTPVLIGIIAIVAVVPILICVSGYLALNGALGGRATARATTTPAGSLALLPSPVIPTVTEVPIDTALPPPTIQVTATEGVTPTRAARRTATPTPAGPTATATLNIPPGVYVTNIETIPVKVNLGDTIGFKVSFLNTTGYVQTYNWLVKWYQCPEQCQDFKHSQGETLTMNSNLATGPSDLSTSLNINIRTGISCNLIAVANFIDPVNQMPMPFQSTKDYGQFSFTPCH